MVHSQNNLNKIEAIGLMNVIVTVCSKLNRDEILFWSRSEEKLKKLLLTPPDVLDRINNMRRERFKKSKEYCIDSHPYKTTWGLLEVFSGLCAKLTQTQGLYWTGVPMTLLRLLQGDEVSFIKETGVPQKVRSLPAEKTMKVFRKTSFKQDQYALHDVIKNLKRTYDSTDAQNAHSYRLACPLNRTEIFRYWGGESEISTYVCTPQQIQQLAFNQQCNSSPGPLSHSGPNYFLVEAQDLSIAFVGIIWIGEKLVKTHKGRWKYWIFDEEYPLARMSGRLILFE